ncbi:MAG: Chlorohydrolase/deaminase family protein [uncultured Rubrobacteraceae bacterium]|uniref:Chlorohydrolase/deaminase family protein n=1 Tax=uncultured Rubrobacteraceae bacterium TaxID=349277 RepID=A0A6J4S8K8_9ACTN|nr:MAG: Chlorohydrolase/deaminase family protein [uncultured Rubrobacteraceae bacterium]
MPQETIVAADLVIRVAASPIRDGAVLVRDGRIAGVGPLSDLVRVAPEVEVRRFSGHTIVPGAVNAHGHLGFRRKDKPAAAPFSVWLKELISKLPEKESWTPEAARDSAREAVESGTTYMAESSPYGECLPQLAASGMAGTVHAEFFPGDYPGTGPQERVEAIFRSVQEMREGLPDRVEVGVSVHSPYTVDPESAGLAAARSRKEGGRLAIHLSESPEEVEFVLKGKGGLVEIFGNNNWGGRGVSPVRYFEELGVLGPNVIAAHLATAVSQDDLDILRATNTAAAHCPRSNEYLDCEVSPVPEMLERGIRVGMGTDGLWSSPSMNLFEETLFAVRLHGMSGDLGLELATLGGAQALGIDGETGSIEAGKYADLAVVGVAPTGDDPGMAVVEAAAGGGVAATMVSGEFVYNQTSS